MRYVNILHALDVNADELFFMLGKIGCISHFYPMSSQMLRYVKIFDINEKLLTSGFTWM